MGSRVEKIMREYRQMLMERSCLENQIRNFQGITENEMIDYLYYSKSDEERVQTSSVSDKTARIAISYQEKMEMINKEWQEQLLRRHSMLAEEIMFFESALRSLSDILPEFIYDMVIQGVTWDCLCDKYHISRTMVAKTRKRAINELERLYFIHDKEITDFMLS